MLVENNSFTLAMDAIANREGIAVKHGLRRCFGRCCDRAASGVWRVGIGVVWNAGIRGMDGVAGNKLSINEISILVVRHWAPRECLC